MKALLIAAGVAALSSTAMAAKLDEKVPYPKADAGFTRQVIHLPKQDAEDAFKVEIIAGKTLEADCTSSAWAASWKSTPWKAGATPTTAWTRSAGR